VDDNKEFRNAIREASIFLAVDAEKGEGEMLAEQFRVNGYPTFIVVNADGKTVDRWNGYGSPDELLAALQGAVSDPTTVAEKLARYEESPNAIDAEKLGDIYRAEKASEKALAMYRAADELNMEPNPGLTGKIFKTLAGGFSSETFSMEEIQAGADAVLAINGEDNIMTLVQVAQTMGMIGNQAGQPDLSTPYIMAALEATEGTQEPGMIKARRSLLLEKALHIDNDLETAVQLKKDSMPEGWKDSAGDLNNFAWWCFENKVNLEQAEKLARSATEMAEPGQERAMILDTLAELCNELGNCGEAVVLMQTALQEDPDNEYYQTQLERFQDLLGQDNRT
jgi:tetratricopeptide (TPR) repeat protein